MNLTISEYDKIMALPKLGCKQRNLLRALIEHTSWFPCCGWLWSTRSETIRILDSLVNRGYATRSDGLHYTATEKWREA